MMTCWLELHFKNSSMLLSHCHYNVMQECQFVNFIITRSNFIVTVMIRVFKFHTSCFRKPPTPNHFLEPNSILRPLLSRKCMIIYFLLFFSGNVQPNPGPVSLHKFNNISPLDVYEPFSVSPSLPKLRLAMLNARSLCNKSAVIYNHIAENNLDVHTTSKINRQIKIILRLIKILY